MHMLKTVTSVLLGLGAASAASIADWAGTWTDEGDGSYGGEFKVCVDAALGTAQGFYSGVGYAYGQVLMVQGVPTWSGAWFEAGEYGFGDNWGYFYLQLNDDASAFNGTWTLANAPAEAHIWADDNINHAVPTKDECWAADYSSSAVSSERTGAANAMTLHGFWKEPGETPKWWVCVSGNTFTSSYEYYDNGVFTVGYITGDVVMHGRVLMGHWFEKDLQGIYLIVAGSDELLRATWWVAADLDHVDVTKLGNDDFQGFDIADRLDWDADEDMCNQYACIVGGCKDDGDDDDDDDDKEAVVVTALAVCVGVSGLAMIAMFAFLYRAGAIGGKHKHTQQGGGADVSNVQLKDTA